MTDRYFELLQKYTELQKAFDDTLEMNRKFGTENVRLEKENEQLKDFLDSTIFKLIEIKTLFVGHQSSELTETEKDFIGEQIKKKLNVVKNNLTYELKEMENDK